MANDTNAKSDPFDDDACEPARDCANDDKDDQRLHAMAFSPEGRHVPDDGRRSIQLNTKAEAASTAVR